MEVRGTGSVKLVVPDERRDGLHESARQFRHPIVLRAFRRKEPVDG
ncbi:MAG: hypothetical protein ACI9TI_002013 [Natronomonas sp.]|jgi:hypothetical protein